MYPPLSAKIAPPLEKNERRIKRYLPKIERRSQQFRSAQFARFQVKEHKADARFVGEHPAQPQKIQALPRHPSLAHLEQRSETPRLTPIYTEFEPAQAALWVISAVARRSRARQTLIKQTQRTVAPQQFKLYGVPAEI